MSAYWLLVIVPGSIVVGMYVATVIVLKGLVRFFGPSK